MAINYEWRDLNPYLYYETVTWILHVYHSITLVFVSLSSKGLILNGRCKNWTYKLSATDSNCLPSPIGERPLGCQVKLVLNPEIIKPEWNWTIILRLRVESFTTKLRALAISCFLLFYTIVMSFTHNPSFTKPYNCYLLNII